ncbi:hypothetical protein ACFY1U_41275 [Streptomyces sp. NPDC001351]|uniref:hypothetical protein n=1 Tax=Streptomyces sp. NPDC001351 TaxID=3364564 RepID=UPI0036B0C732
MAVSTINPRKLLGRVPVTTVAAVAGLPVALLGLFVAAVVPSGWAFAVFAAADYLAEPRALRRIARSMQPLGQVCLSVTAGSLLRGAAALVLLARLGDAQCGAFVLTALGFLALQALRGGYAGLLLFVWWCRRLPVVTRNVDLSALRIPDAPPRPLMDLHRGPLALVDLPLVVGVAVAAAAGPKWAAIGAGTAVLAALTTAGWLALHAWRGRHLAAKGKLLHAVNEQVEAYRPEVVVYFSGALESAYQLNGWLPVLDRLRRRVVVVLREREMLTRLDPTSRPVVCLPLGKDLTAFRLPEAHVALFVANAANNTHLLRLPEFRSVYLGHGDSDKPTSSNPFTKVYDEVWVAGPAGRARYARSGSGVADADVVEVGRPSLGRLNAAGGTSASPIPTVLYAPTWEGFHGDPGAATSLTGMGPRIVKALLEREPAVRLLYRPHPLTGTLDPRARAAHTEILAMIDEANTARDAREEFRREDTREQAAQAARLPELARRLDELRRPARGDEAQAARDAGGSEEPPSAAWESALAEWNAAYWAAEGWWRHRVTGGSRPGLYDCFDHADLLIADVSGVVTDYLATGKPYAVANPAGLAPDTFRDRYPAARAAHLIGPDLAGLDDLLDGKTDPLAKERQRLRAYLLGPATPDPLAPFERALDNLLVRAKRAL